MGCNATPKGLHAERDYRRASHGGAAPAAASRHATCRLPALLTVLTASSTCARAFQGSHDAQLAQRMCPPVTLLFLVFQRDAGATVSPGSPALPPRVGLPIPALSCHTALASQARVHRDHRGAMPRQAGLL